MAPNATQDTPPDERRSLMIGFLQGAKGESATYRVSRRDLKVDHQQEDETVLVLDDNADAGKWTFRVACEAWRFIAYIAFWIMVVIAVIITRRRVVLTSQLDHRRVIPVDLLTVRSTLMALTSIQVCYHAER